MARTFILQKANIIGRKVRIIDSTTNNEIYTLELHSFAPNLVFHHTSAPTSTLANLTFSLTGSTMTAEFPSSQSGFEVKAKGWTQKEHSYTSAGKTYTWSGRSKLVCSDERGVTVAKCGLPSFTMSKLGTIDILDDQMEERVVHEMVVVAAAILVKLTRMLAAAAS